MRIKLYSVVIVIAMVLGGTVSSSPVDEVGTIVLKSGETFENVHYKVNKNYYVITIIDGDSEKKVLFSDVASIHTVDGVDISDSVLGIRGTPIGKTAIGVAPKTGETWQSADSEVHVKAREKKWDVALSFKLGYNAPTGEFYEGIAGGLGFGGDIRLAVSNQLALIGTVGLAGIDFDNSIILVSPEPQVSILSQDFSMNATRILVGIEYYQSLNKRRDRAGMWYFHTLIGVINHNLSSDVTMRDNVSGQVVNFSTSDSFTQFTTTIGGGMVPMLSPKIGLDLSGDLDLVWVKLQSGTSSDVDVRGFVFDFHAGLMFFL